MNAPPFRRIQVVGLAFLLARPGLDAQATGVSRRPLVEVRTTQGRMVVALFNETPIHRDNFLELVTRRYYDSTLIHRAVPELMLLGGDPDSKLAVANPFLGTGGPGYSLASEVRPDLHHFRGALSAAPATVDEPGREQTHGSQFFFVLGRLSEGADLDRLIERARERGDTLTFSEKARKTYATVGGSPHMDGVYTVFGEVVEGLEVLDAIANQPCDQQDRPLTDVRIWMRELP